MSIKITGNGIESSHDIEIKSIYGAVKVNESVPSLPRKVKTDLGHGDIIELNDGEGLVTPPLSFNQGGQLIIKPGSKLRIV